MTRSRKFLCILLSVMLLLPMVPVPSAAAQPGDALGWVLYTDIVAYIDGYPIRSYNIKGNTYVVVEDLMEYGFTVTWDPSAGRLTISDRLGTVTSDYTPAENTHEPGEHAMPYLYTEITTWIYSTQITGYNIGGYTCICMDDLAAHYAADYVWDPAALALRMTVTPIAEAPDFLPDVPETPDPRPVDPAPVPVIPEPDPVLPGPQPQLPVTPTQPTLTAQTIYTACAPAVFYLEVYDQYGEAISGGSGFFIDSSGIAVTNYHVIAGGHSARIQTANGWMYDVDFVYDYDMAQDWAVLKIAGSGFPTLTMGDSSTVAGGATVYAIGSSLGPQAAITQGIISNPARYEDGVTYIQTSAAISSGNSGGALINRYGEVIGITSASYEGGESLNLALPIQVIGNFSTTEPTTLAELAQVGRLSAYLRLYSWIAENANFDYFEDGGMDSYRHIFENGDELYMVLSELEGEECLYFLRVADMEETYAVLQMAVYPMEEVIDTELQLYDTRYNQKLFTGVKAVVGGAFSEYCFDEINSFSSYNTAEDIALLEVTSLVLILECLEVIETEMGQYEGSVDWMFESLGFGDFLE